MPQVKGGVWSGLGLGSGGDCLSLFYQFAVRVRVKVRRIADFYKLLLQIKTKSGEI